MNNISIAKSKFTSYISVILTLRSIPGNMQKSLRISGAGDMYCMNILLIKTLLNAYISMRICHSQKKIPRKCFYFVFIKKTPPLFLKCFVIKCTIFPNKRTSAWKTHRSKVYQFCIRVPFYQHGLTLISAWMSNYTHLKVWYEITYPFLNFNGAAVEV